MTQTNFQNSNENNLNANRLITNNFNSITSNFRNGNNNSNMNIELNNQLFNKFKRIDIYIKPIIIYHQKNGFYVKFIIYFYPRY